MDHGTPDRGRRPNQNVNVFEKPAAETMRERAHLGSANWVDSPGLTAAFARGAADEKTPPGSVVDQPYASETHDGQMTLHYSRPAHAVARS